jgi:BON domain
MDTNRILQQSAGALRSTVRTTERFGRRVVSDTFGLLARATRLRQAPKEMDDVTLARKVETEVFRDRRTPKGSVDVNVVDGVVWLRGEVKRPEQIRALERNARSIPEVRGVENLLHLPKTAAPTRADTPPRQQRTRSSTRRPTPRQKSGGRVTDDRTDALSAEAEPSPEEHAQEREGRTPAPMGSTDRTSGPTSD